MCLLGSYCKSLLFCDILRYEMTESQMKYIYIYIKTKKQRENQFEFSKLQVMQLMNTHANNMQSI